MLMKVQINILIEIEVKDNDTFDVVLSRSSTPVLHGQFYNDTSPKEFGRNNFNTRAEAEEEAMKMKKHFERP